MSIKYTIMMRDKMKNTKIRKNLLLDNETIDILEDYSTRKDGTKNISSAIRSMARDHKKNNVIKPKTNGDN